MRHTSGLRNPFFALALAALVPAAAQAQEVVASPPSLLFDEQQVGTTSAPKLVSVMNETASPITLGDITVPANFELRSTQPPCASGTQVAPDDFCSVQVVYSPDSEGEHTGTLSFAVQGGSAVQVPLTGSAGPDGLGNAPGEGGGCTQVPAGGVLGLVTLLGLARRRRR